MADLSESDETIYGKILYLTTHVPTYILCTVYIFPAYYTDPTSST